MESRPGFFKNGDVRDCLEGHGDSSSVKWCMAVIIGYGVGMESLTKAVGRGSSEHAEVLDIMSLVMFST